MPTKAPPPKRQAVEAELSVSELSALRQLCQALGIPSDRWHLVNHLWRPWALLAFERRVDRLSSEGMTRERATIQAELDLGLYAKTAETWSRRWVLEAYRAPSG